ncbi:Retrovirus-related Pol polyprotein from transposon 17.6 [Araneus ventricosus]|uniref:Retrovirus-related Pol polyprotein from transposon 17.6 n=1 Tax=Araneus ventricosus TaxID=182803 RepID=A0A4Y2TCU2_ARAVE|nr:Retrovirus-related Pol polyprotein from transposon 17.6 [Araneus ventricosus]
MMPKIVGFEEHPIEYASRLLNSAERNYSTTEREALAVVWALNKFRGYIEGSKITVASDHQPLKCLMKLKSPSGRLARWALQLQSFNLNLEYIPGKSNVVGDMLSRLGYDQEISSCEENTVSIDFPARSPMKIREEQLKAEDRRKSSIASRMMIKIRPCQLVRKRVSHESGRTVKIFP